MISSETSPVETRRLSMMSLKSVNFRHCFKNSKIQNHPLRNGYKGLEALATQGADLVILDLGLPDLDGKEVLQELRSWSNVPVIVLSVRADEYEKLLC